MESKLPVPSRGAIRKSGPERHMDESFLGITPDILACFPTYAIPMRLYQLADGSGSLMPFARAEERLTRDKRQKLQELAASGRVCVSRADRAAYVTTMADNIHVLLREKQFTPEETAEIMLGCMTRRIGELYHQPIKSNYTHFYEDAEVVAWLLLEEPRTAIHALGRLHTGYSLVNKCVNTGFLGLAMLLRERLRTIRFEELAKAAVALFLHDIGLLRVQTFIRDKTQPLSVTDWRRIREHPAEGVAVLKKLGCLDEEIHACILEHHERLDGSGYPRRLRGESVSDLARLCGVAEAFCAMRFDRAYRPGLPARQALDTLMRDPRRFDPALVRAIGRILGSRLTEPVLPAAIARFGNTADRSF